MVHLTNRIRLFHLVHFMRLLKGIFFHLLPMAMAGGRFSPGTFSGLLFYVIGWIALTSASATGSNVTWAVVIGAAVILWPMLLLQLKREAYFRGEAAPAKKPAKRRK